MKKKINAKNVSERILGLLLVSAIVAPQLSRAQDDTEWEAGEGYHDEEWYDPSDWFDNDNSTDYEYDYTYGDVYDDDYYYDGYWDGLDWYDEYDYYDPYYTDYTWDSETDSWVTDYDYGYDYDFSDDNNNNNNNSSTLKGTVQAFTQVELEDSAGFTEQHALARIKLNNGRSAIVDLGRASLFGADLSQGDSVTLYGEKGSINGRSVFIANRLNAQGETAYIDRSFRTGSKSGNQNRSRSGDRDRTGSSMSDRNTSAKYQMDDRSGNRSRNNQGNRSMSSRGDGKSLVLSGEIDRMSNANLPGESDRQSLVRLRMQDGKAATVNLGSQLTASKLGLEQGDRVRIQGSTKQIEGQTVLMAESIKIHPENRGQRQGRQGSSGSRTQGNR